MPNFIPTKSVAARDESPADAMARGVPCWIGFGGNVGDVKATFDAALALLSLHQQIGLGQRSGIYGTAPVGSHAGQPFLNAICGLTTPLSSRELLQVLQSVENQLGRIRDVRWGPRTLDLDLIAYGREVVNQPDLIVPHPALAYRRFVLDPLVEVDPDWLHPRISLTAKQLRNRLTNRPLRVRIAGCLPPQIEKLSAQLGPTFPELQLITDLRDSTDALVIKADSSADTSTEGIIDVSHSPGCPLERLSSTLTAIFDVPRRILDW